ncbi:hypothetical protein SK128_020610, partial [Halocaridina rubra]
IGKCSENGATYQRTHVFSGEAIQLMSGNLVIFHWARENKINSQGNFPINGRL